MEELTPRGAEIRLGLLPGRTARRPSASGAPWWPRLASAERGDLRALQIGAPKVR